MGRPRKVSNLQAAGPENGAPNSFSEFPARKRQKFPEFLQTVRGYPPEASISIYIYRIWPKIDRGLVGLTTNYIDKTLSLDEDYVLRTHGSGKYRLRLNDYSTGTKKGFEVAYCDLDISDPDFPPVLDPAELVIGSDENKGYIEGLKARGLWKPEGETMGTQQADNGNAAAVEKLTDTVVTLARENKQQAPREDALNLALKLVETFKGSQPDPLAQAAKLKELLGGGSSASDVLMKTLLDNQTKLAELVMQKREGPGALGSLKEAAEFLDTYGGGGGRRGGSDVGSAVGDFLRSLPQLVAGFGQLMGAYAAMRQPMPGQAQVFAPVPAYPAGPAPFAPGEMPGAFPSLPDSSQGGDSMPSMARLFVIGQRALSAFKRGISGEDFAHALCSMEDDGETIYDTLFQLGADGILSTLKGSPVWSQVAADELRLAEWLRAFIAYGSEPAEPAEPAAPASGVAE